MEPETGDLINVTSFGLTVATEGELTQVCADLNCGEAELVGGWCVSEVPRTARID